jgi:hypothetical protein
LLITDVAMRNVVNVQGDSGGVTATYGAHF